MGRHRNTVVRHEPQVIDEVPVPRRAMRRQNALPLFASATALAFVLVAVTSPIAQNRAAAAEVMAQVEQLPTQQFVVAGDYSTGITRDPYKVTDKPKPPPPPPPTATSTSTGRSVPAAGTPDPGTAKAIAHEMVMARGWGEDQYDCLVALWQRESGWNVFAMNKSSGAYGIPQSLPGNKMASAGADWATNPATQITWGLGYISGRYGNPCGAWAASESKGWY